MQYCNPNFPVVKNSTGHIYTQSKIADLNTRNWLSNSLSSRNQIMQVNSKINCFKIPKYAQNTLYAPSNFNLNLSFTRYYMNTKDAVYSKFKK